MHTLPQPGQREGNVQRHNLRYRLQFWLPRLRRRLRFQHKRVDLWSSLRGLPGCSELHGHM